MEQFLFNYFCLNIIYRQTILIIHKLILNLIVNYILDSLLILKISLNLTVENIYFQIVVSNYNCQFILWISKYMK